MRVIISTGPLLALAAVGVVALAAIVRRAAAAVSIGILVFVLSMVLGPVGFHTAPAPSDLW